MCLTYVSPILLLLDGVVKYDGRVCLHRLFDVNDERLGIVTHRDQGYGILGYGQALGRNPAQGLPDILDHGVPSLVLLFTFFLFVLDQVDGMDSGQVLRL